MTSCPPGCVRHGGAPPVGWLQEEEAPWRTQPGGGEISVGAASNV